MSPAAVYPENPIFRSPGERAVFEALLPQLSEGDAIFANLEISDSVDGDIEIDLAVLLKDHGLIVVEVKGAHISHDGNYWIQSDPSGSHAIHPAEQSRRNLYALRNFIHTKWSLGLLRSDWVVAFPHCNIVDAEDPVLPLGKIIQKDGLAHMLSQLKSILNTQRDYSLPNFENWVEIATKNLLPIVVQKTNPKAILGNNYEFIRSLTHEREVLLDQLSENMRYYVQGPAGSGKTWLAFEQDKRWSKAGKRVGIICYNRGLTTYMQGKNGELPEAERVAYVGTFHDYAHLIGSEAGDPEHYKDEIDRYRDDLILKAEQVSLERKFDAFVIDEAQDFLPAWWQVVELSLKDPASGQLALFGDDQQKIFGERPPPEGNFAKFRLLENLRNSQQIAKAAHSLITRPAVARGPHSFEIEYISVADDGDQVPFTAPWKSIHAAADDVVEKLVDQERWEPREIALLTIQHRHPVQSIRDDEDKMMNWRSFWEDEDVFYCTVGGFKGLERPVVVLAIDGFHDGINPNDLLYVGISRARDKLVVVGDPKEIAWIQSKVTRVNPLLA